MQLSTLKDVSCKEGACTGSASVSMVATSLVLQAPLIFICSYGLLTLLVFHGEVGNHFCTRHSHLKLMIIGIIYAYVLDQT